MKQIEEIAKGKPKSIILREKDLSEEAYFELAKEVMAICDKQNVLCVLHSFISVARKLKAPAIHLPMEKLRGLSEEERKDFSVIGASCHSVEEAVEAKSLGCSYITAGHIFATDCKKGLEPRGLSFLEEVCKAVEIPVYGIGGIDKSKVSLLKQAGAKGACVMSGFMKCDDPKEYIKALGKE